MNHLKIILSLLTLLFFNQLGFSQKVDSIYFDLYTDSLKKGTYNYINVIGKLTNGRYRPLDSTQLIFDASYGKFTGNSLWLPFEPEVEKVELTVTLRTNPTRVLSRTIYIKKAEDSEGLKTVDEILSVPSRPKKRKKN